MPNCFDRVCGPDGCGGSCGTCPLVGQVCNRGACECPADKPVVCGAACRAPCPVNTVRNPNTCDCCVPGSQFRAGSEQCCAGAERSDGYCFGLFSGAACTFDAECHFEYQCNAGKCDKCYISTDFCRTGDTVNHTCNGGSALCLRTLANRTRCGVRNRNVACNGCSSDQDCLIDLGQGSGAFCVVDTGAYCDCPDGQTFCAVPR